MEKIKCKFCKEELVYIPPTKRSNVAAWILLILGIFCVWFLVGIIFIIIAFSLGFTKREGDIFVCPRCGNKFTRDELQQHQAEEEVSTNVIGEEK